MPGYAALYLSDPTLMGSWFFDRFEEIRSYEDQSDHNSATGVTFVLDQGQVTMNFMPDQELAQHMEGFAEFAKRVVRSKDDLTYVLSRMFYVDLVCGCVITPDFDKGGKLKEFLFRFVREANGLLFMADAIFDAEGRVLGGTTV